jgi:hypothetical protein
MDFPDEPTTSLNTAPSTSSSVSGGKTSTSSGSNGRSKSKTKSKGGDSEGEDDGKDGRDVLTRSKKSGGSEGSGEGGDKRPFGENLQQSSSIISDEKRVTVTTEKVVQSSLTSRATHSITMTCSIRKKNQWSTGSSVKIRSAYKITVSCRTLKYL